ALGAAHPLHRAPSRASLCVTALTAGIVAVSALARFDPVVEIYTWYSGLGAVGVILMMALTSLAVLRFGARRGERRAGAGVLAATALGGLGLLLVLGISLSNLPLMVGGTVAAIVCAGMLVAVFVLGAVLPRGRATTTAVADADHDAGNDAGQDAGEAEERAPSRR